MRYEKMRKINFEKVFKSNFKLKLFFLSNLPMGLLNGLKVEDFNENSASVSVPFNYFTKNPFRSIYFAVLSMAAELSTAVLVFINIGRLKRPFSMLVLDMKGEFVKKAKSRVTFTCNDGQKIKQTLEKAHKNNEPQTVTVQTTGTDKDGNIVSKFTFTWTLKPK